MLLDDVGKAFLFKRFRPYLREYFMKAGIVEVPYRFFGLLFWLSFLLTGGVYIFKLYPIIAGMQNNLISLFVLTFLAWIVVQSLLIAAIILCVYFYLDLVIYNRTAEMEEVLQEFLRLVAQNLKGGMPFERALWSAIKPEFGILGNEIQLAAKKVMTGHDVDEALTEFTMKYNSPTLRRSFTLVVEALESGGEIAETIERIAEDIEETRELKREMSATNLTYVMFIIFIVVVITPGLFTLSYQFLRMLQSFAEKLSYSTAQTAVALPFSISKPAIGLDDYKEFSRNALLIISCFSAMMVSIIRNGDIKAGIKYIPFLAAFSLAFYFMFMFLAQGMFGNILKI
jgi:pilus assembly protein TadC